MLAIFRSAHHAAAAALSIQGTLESLRFAEEVGNLHVRIALHTGEPQHRSGDYFGPTLNVCARMVTIAGPSQILVSLAAAELLHGDPTPSVVLTDLGEHILPDIDRPEHLYQLTNTSDLSPASA
jgi:class 3 adenylate cyclase